MGDVMTMRIPRFFAIDIDGTFVTKNIFMPYQNKYFFDKLVKTNVIPFFCTGRARSDTLHITGYHTSDVYNGFPGVYLNGSVVYNHKGDVLLNRHFDKDTYVKIIDVLQSLGLINSLTCASQDMFYFRPELKPHILGQTTLHIKYIEIEDFKSIKDLKFNGMLVFGVKPDQLEVLKQHDGDYYIIYDDEYNTTLAVPGVSKIDGIKALIDHYNGTLDDVMAIGDGPNDVGMLSAIKNSYAVSDASPEAKAAASKITIAARDGAVGKVISEVFNIT